MLTNKGKYGLKAMVHLAGLEPGSVAQVTEIAETNSISKKFLDHILTELRHARFVYSKKGRGGGYALARPANEIRVGAIIRVLGADVDRYSFIASDLHRLLLAGLPANNPLSSTRKSARTALVPGARNPSTI